MRAWRAAAAASVAAAALTVAIPGAQAAPLLAATTRVGPTTLPDSLILDQTADGRFVLAGTTTGSSVQRIDRQGNTATAASTLPDLNVGLTDDGAGVISLAVDSWRQHHRDPDQPGQRRRQLRHRRLARHWRLVAPGRDLGQQRRPRHRLQRPRRSTGRQVVAVANTNAPASVSSVDVGLPAGGTRRSESPSISATAATSRSSRRRRPRVAPTAPAAATCGSVTSSATPAR